MKKENMSPLRYYTIMQTKKLLDRISSKDLIVTMPGMEIQV